MYPLPPLDVVRYGDIHGKVAAEMPHFNPWIRGDCGGQLVTELKIRFSVNGCLRSSTRSGGASRRQLRAFVSCFVYYFSLSESIRDSIVSHYERNYGVFCSRHQIRKQQAVSLVVSLVLQEWILLE